MQRQLRIGRFFPVALIVIVGLAVYWHTLDSPFQYDDYNNINIQAFAVPATSRTVLDFENYLSNTGPIDSPGFEDFRLFKTRYFFYLTLLANYKLGGLDVKGYHITNLSLHIVNALLVYLLVLLTFKTPELEGTRLQKHAGTVSIFAGLIFVAHPIQTEAVTYISQRSTLLAAMFCLGSITAYCGSRLSKGLRRSEGLRLWAGLYVLSVVCAVAAMKSKEIAFTLPLVVLLYEVLFFRASFKSTLLRVFPLFLTMLIIPAAYLGQYMQGDSLMGALGQATRFSGSPISRSAYLFTEFAVVFKYILLLFLPINQNVDHDMSVYHSFLEPGVFLPFIGLAGIFGVACYLLVRSRRAPELRLISFGVIWFFLALTMNSSVFPTHEVIVEYRLYLPAVGFITAVLGGVFMLYGSVSSAFVRKTFFVFLALTMVALGTAAYMRNSVWASDMALWGDSVAKSPFKSRPYLNRGLAYERRGILQRALSDYNQAIELTKSERPLYLFNRAGIYIKLKKPLKAIEDLSRAVSMDKKQAYYIRMGIALKQVGRLEEALQSYNTAFELSVTPGLELLNNRAAVLIKLRRFDEALKDLRGANSLNPASTDVQINLALALVKRGQPQAAIVFLSEALKHTGQPAEVLMFRGQIFEGLGKLNAAALDYKQAAAMRGKGNEAGPSAH